MIVLEQVRYLALERLKADRGCEIQLLDLLSPEQERRPPPKSLHQQLPASDRGKAVSLSRDPQILPARAGTRDPSRSRPMETSKPLLEAEHGNASRGDERRDKKHTGFKEKISDLAEKVGDKMTSTHHTQPERMRHTTPPTSPQGLTIITEEADQPVETSRGIRGQTADDVHPATKGPDLHLPAATQDFLEAGQRHPPTRSSKPKGSKNVKLTPARIVKTTDVTGTHRGRPSWSSESHYSDDMSDGTIESDEGAGELLATADSGPAPAGVHGIGERQDRYHMENEEQSPDDDQVREAEDVLLNGETAKVKKEHKTLRKKREEEGKE